MSEETDKAPAAFGEGQCGLDSMIASGEASRADRNRG
ncbi:hypothetical protein QBD00_004573 [Ochrobactrum sp. AN78]|nr:hypothetical protein [Ochrobactrum sp. AN78]